MLHFNDFVGSIIDSILGPNKCSKILMQDEEFSIVSCPLYILQNTQFQIVMQLHTAVFSTARLGRIFSSFPALHNKIRNSLGVDKAVKLDPLSALVEETLFAHHSLYGCSTLTLLTMWHLWSKEFRLVLEEGYRMEDINEQSQRLLEFIVSGLPDIALDFNTLFFEKYVHEEISNKFQAKKNIFNLVPITVQYSSRHFSPSQNSLNFKECEDGNLSQNCELDENHLEIIIQNLDHNGDTEIRNLVLECWKKQLSFSGSFRFKTDALLICPLILPSNSAVVDGLLFKSCLNLSGYEGRKKAFTKSLILNGSVTYEYVHLGFRPNVAISIQQTAATTRKDIWREKTCRIIKQLNLDVLLVKDDVDPDIASFCSAHSVSVISCIPGKAFKILCKALQYSPSHYISDYKEEDIIENVTLQEWKPQSTLELKEQYILINAPSKNRLQTIILCSPSEAVLKRNEHTMDHLMSRLSFSSQNQKLLPGGGKSEKWSAQKLQKQLQFSQGPAARITKALLGGFKAYSDIISNKMSLSQPPVPEVLDEMSSKVDAWQSALSLVLLTLQCDALAINGLQDTDAINANTL